MGNDVTVLFSGLIGLITLITFFVVSANIGAIKSMLREATKVKSYKCNQCEYTFTASNYHSPFCPRCGKDSEGKRQEDYK